MCLPSSSFASVPIRCIAALTICVPLSTSALRAQQQPATQPARTSAFLAQRQAADRTSPALALQRARAQHAALLLQQRSHPDINLTAAWTPLGPTSILSPTFGNLTGRITSLALDPNDNTGNTLYAGTTGSGVWKSTNAAGSLAAITFAPLTDTLPVFSTGAIASLSIGALALQPTTNPILLAGTGDPNDATDSYYGEGILRSADDGLTWTLITGSHDGTNGNHSFAGLSTAAIAFSTATPMLTVAAFSNSPESTEVEAANIASIPGLYYSADAGTTWQMATVYDGTQIVQQPQPVGTQQLGNAATSVVWDALRARFFAAIRFHGYYSSPDGVTWTRLPTQPGTNLTTANCPVGLNGVGSSACPIFRGVLAAQSVTGDLYALTVDANDLDQGLWQDLCNATANTCATASPAFANRIDNAALEAGSGNTAIPQGTYNLTLAATPVASGTILYAGTVDLYRCAIAPNTSTCALRNTTNALNGCSTPAKVAPAQHAITTLPAGPLVFLGNDGGLWRSTDGIAETGSPCAATDASHFDNLNAAIATGGSLAEIIGFAQHPTDTNTLIAGLGTNGSAATSTASALSAWQQLSAGEGGQPSLDATTPTNWLLSIGAGINLKQCTLGAACTAANFATPATIGEPQVANDTALIDAPNMLDPALTSNVLLGTCRVYRGPAASSATWSTANAISPAFNNSATPCTAASPLIRSLAAGGPTVTSSNAQLSGSQVLYAGIAGSVDGGANIPGDIFITKSANTAFTTTSWSNAALGPVTNDLANSYVFNPDGFDVSSIAVDPHDPTGATVYATIMGFGGLSSASPHLYRSIDFGAHWLNISANLPDAPANAVAVDPNDANTVYVALDTGIYVTAAITTCPTTNCWGVFGTALPNAPVVALATAAQQPTGDGRRGMLRAATYGRGIWQTPLAAAVSIAQPAITLSTTSLTFPTQQVATLSPAQTITVTSSGNSPITFTTPAFTGDFTITANTCTQTLAVNATCTVSVAFAPTATGARTGLLTLYANIATGQATVALSGTATAPAAITLSPLTLTFAATLVNQTTTAQNITVNNTGGTTATLQNPVITGDFAISANTCSTSLAPSAGCTISITFTPTTSGLRSGTLSITDTSTGVISTQTAQLTGTGQAPATDTLAPTALTFAQQQIGTTSPSQQLTLTNTGDVALTLITATLTPGDFNVTNGCGNSLAAHSNCALIITFTPTAIGTRSATLSLTDEFRTQTVPLTGTGVAPPGVSLSPMTPIMFPNTGVTLNSLPQTVTLTNSGGLPLTISSIAVTPNFTIAANTCGATLAINNACTLTILFAPIAPGPLTGTLTLTDNAPTPTQTVSLSGLGIDFTLAPNGPTSMSITNGSSAMYPLLLSSLATVTGSVAFTCTGAPTNSICTVNPTTPSLGATTSITATVETGVQARFDPHGVIPRRSANTIYLGISFPLVLILGRRRTTNLLLLILLAATLASLTACGSGRAIPCASDCTTAAMYPTPSGTYNLTVTASAAGIAHTVPLTLIVQ